MTCRGSDLLRRALCYLLFEMNPLSHVDEHGRIQMVDTGGKEISSRRAVASARVLMKSETVNALKTQRTPKGDPLEAARLAGIMAAKKTAAMLLDNTVSMFPIRNARYKR